MLPYPRRTSKVALRKESVDRNNLAPVPGGDEPVALRKESVDRNRDLAEWIAFFPGRSPQGERG